MGEYIIRMLEKAARNGDVKAQYVLGEMYVNGILCEINYDKAEKWWKLASKKNDDAKAGLAVLYMKQNKNYIEIYKLLEEAANNGNVLAQSNLGIAYFRGDSGIEQNYEKAVKWLKEAAAVGDKTAQNDLALCYLEGRSVKKDIQKAIKLFESSVNQGFPQAYMNLGKIYYEGNSIEKNYAKAEKYCIELVKMGYVIYYDLLGDIYREGGYGVEKDETKAYICYHRLMNLINLMINVKKIDKNYGNDLKILEQVIKSLNKKIKLLDEKIEDNEAKCIRNLLQKYMTFGYNNNQLIIIN